ncbi:MAG: molybdenum cofactor biosynthesis protein MoaE [Candidatus Neomarinimicrobiota bacterium]
MVETRILDGPLPPLDDASAPGDGQDGAELLFHGRVRGTEADRPIVALDYEAYLPLAETELRAVAEDTAARFPVRSLVCLPRIGRIEVGEASMRVTIRSLHRTEGIQALAYFIEQLKDRVPIWKWGVTEQGERFPSRGGHGPPNP